MSDRAAVDRSAELAALVGSSTGPPLLSPHPVNAPMIRHWVEAMGDQNLAYLDDEVARAAGLPAAVAPPAMLQAWTMRGLRATLAVEAARAAGLAEDASPQATLMALLDDEGLTSVVATNCEQTYDRPLVVGDRIVSTSVIEAVSDLKTTALGTGRFVTTRTDFSAVDDDSVRPGDDAAELAARAEHVATMRFRILKYRPVERAAPARRPRPALTPDIDWWFAAAAEGRLLIQRCAACGVLRHPPLPACGSCRSFEWDTVEASGRGRLFSFVVVHHPQVPGFDYPLPIGLVELEEGTRLVAGLRGDPGSFAVGQDLVVEFVRYDPDLTLPVFGAADGGGDG